MKPALSILDQSPVLAGHTPAEAIPDTLELARLADRLGYTRYWLSEHHNMASVASASPVILIGYIANGTTLAVGAHRRVRALAAMGWSTADIAERGTVTRAALAKIRERGVISTTTWAEVARHLPTVLAVEVLEPAGTVDADD